MKVLIVNKFLYPNGGSETYVFEVGKCLESMGHEVQYFGMEHEGRIVGNRLNLYTRDMDFHGGGLKGKLAKLTYPFRVIRSREAYDKMMRILDDYHPDVVHFNNINFQLTRPDGTICYDCRGCRYHNCVKHRCIHGSLIRGMLGAVETGFYHRRETYGLIDTIIAPSAYMRDILE